MSLFRFFIYKDLCKKSKEPNKKIDIKTINSYKIEKILISKNIKLVINFFKNRILDLFF